MAEISPDELEARSDLWEALSELFAGRELQDYDYRAIATTLRASGRTMTELEEVLRRDVAPVFGSNLSRFNPVPEMESWSREFVRDRVIDQRRKRFVLFGLLARLRPDPLNNPILRHRWHRVCNLLADER
jgi:hypothetical protein